VDRKAVANRSRRSTTKFEPESANLFLSTHIIINHLFIKLYFIVSHKLYGLSVFHKKNIIQLECVIKTYIKDFMYLKRNTKFLPDRWGLKTSPASQSSLNEIVFRSVKSLRKVDFSKNG
jgi:hypothetical protein